MNAKKIFIKFLLCHLLVFLNFVSIINVFAIAEISKIDDIYTHQNEELSSFIDCCDENDNYIQLVSEKFHYLYDDNIEITYSISNEIEIIDISHSETGFNLISINVDDEVNNEIIVVLSYLLNSFEHTFTLQIEFENGNKAIASLYAINNEHGVFISPFSIDDAREKYYSFAILEGFMSQEECIALRNEYNRESVIEDIIIQKPTLYTDNVINPMYIPSLPETSVNGMLQWTDDDNNIHPLRGTLVKIYDIQAFGTTYLGTVYTDNYGNFSYSIFNSDGLWDYEQSGYNIFIRVYAGDTNVMVEISDSGDEYYYESTISENISSGSTLTFNCNFTMENDLGKAFQISQAIITARDYSWVMIGEKPTDVKIKFPSTNGCSYIYGSLCIYITGNKCEDDNYPQAYASWDTLMHEYGHHIQYIVDNTDNPKKIHFSSVNSADIYNNKDIGIRLAWAEAWPTIFALMAQQYYSAYLTNIETTGDTFYTSYKEINYDIENNTSIILGEACERSIMSVLWDLFDSNNDNQDTISLGHSSYWDVTAFEGCFTFSDFISYFYDEYPSYIDDIGANLTYYGMATTKPYISNTSNVSQTVPPTFSWIAQGGSTKFPNNSFALIFYDSTGKEILTTENSTSCTYNLTQNEWNDVLYSYGKTYTVAVATTQTDFPITGEYISAKSVTYTKPTPNNLSKTLNIDANNKYTEEIINLQPGQYMEFTINFSSGGNKLIQTFGANDSKIYLYDSEYNLLVQNDDSGYSSNALLNYTAETETTYILKVQFFNESQSGKIKIGITPASSAHSTFENILNSEGKSITYFFPTYLNTTRVITFTPTESGTYKFTTNYDEETRIDTYLYFVDPSTVEPCLYNDDGAGDLQATLSAELEVGKTYFIIVSPYNITTTSGSLTLNVTKIS